VGGDLERQDVEILSESIEEVSCRWCGTGASVVELTAEEVAGVPVIPPS